VPLHPRRPQARCLSCDIPLPKDAPTWWKRCIRCFAGVQLARALRIYREAHE
jgi:hypothetical protein